MPAVEVLNELLRLRVPSAVQSAVIELYSTSTKLIFSGTCQNIGRVVMSY